MIMAKKNKVVFPKELTTVTTLSKLVAMALFVLLPFIGFIFGLKYRNDYRDYRNQKVTQEDMSRWKIFESEKYTFSIQYPSEWIAAAPIPTEETDISGTLHFTKGVGPLQMSLEVAPSYGTTIDLQANAVRNLGWDNLKEKEIIIDGERAIRLVGSEGNSPRAMVIFAHNEYIYTIQSILLEDQSRFNQVISTFRFTQ